MSNKSQRYSDYLSPRGSGAFLTGQSYDKSQYYSNQQFTEDDRGTNVTKQQKLYLNIALLCV